MRLAILACLITPSLLPAVAHAAEADDGDTIIVSALRAPVEADRAAATVTVIDDAAITAAQPIALTDILVRTPGVSLTRNGGYGTATSLRIRGADASQSVMVLDGMRLSDPSATAGGYGFANLFADDLERIEILRGPQSILWGSDAIGGVINATTRKPTRAIEGGFAVEAGSHDTVNARAALGGTSEPADWRVSLSRFTTQGISARSNGVEPDGYTRSAATGGATIRIAPQLSLDLRGYWADARNDFDGVSGDSAAYGLTREWSGYAGLNVSLFGGALVNRIAVTQVDTDRRNYDPARSIRALTFDAHGRVRRYEYQGTVDLSQHVQLVFGAEREEQRMTSASPSNSTAPYLLVPNSADTNSLFGQVRATVVAGLTLEAGVRHARRSRFGANTVASAGLAYSPDGGATVLRASYDEGYKAPSLYQLFSLYGEAGLKPEQARGWHVGIEHSLGRAFHASATWFARDTDNLIDFAFCPTSGALPPSCYLPGTSTTRFGYYANVRRSRAKGIELAAEARLGALFANANYSWVSAQDRSDGSSDLGRQLARAPRHLANAEAGAELPSGGRASVAARYSGATFDRAGSALVLPGYWLVDVRAQWTVAKGLILQGRIENLTDKIYETASGYSSLGRTAYLGVRSRF
jgi:vitamin B12 transporter